MAVSTTSFDYNLDNLAIGPGNNTLNTYTDKTFTDNVEKYGREGGSGEVSRLRFAFECTTASQAGVLKDRDQLGVKYDMFQAAKAKAAGIAFVPDASREQQVSKFKPMMDIAHLSFCWDFLRDACDVFAVHKSNVKKQKMSAFDFIKSVASDQVKQPNIRMDKATMAARLATTAEEDKIDADILSEIESRLRRAANPKPLTEAQVKAGKAPPHKLCAEAAAVCLNAATLLHVEIVRLGGTSADREKVEQARKDKVLNSVAYIKAVDDGILVKDDAKILATAMVAELAEMGLDRKGQPLDDADADADATVNADADAEKDAA